MGKDDRRAQARGRRPHTRRYDARRPVRDHRRSRGRRGDVRARRRPVARAASSRCGCRGWATGSRPSWPRRTPPRRSRCTPRRSSCSRPSAARRTGRRRGHGSTRSPTTFTTGCSSASRWPSSPTVAGVHRAHLVRAFRARFGISVGAYVRRERIRWAARALRNSDAPIAEIALQAGFADQSHFTRTFVTPHGCVARPLPARLTPPLRGYMRGVISRRTFIQRAGLGALVLAGAPRRCPRRSAQAALARDVAFRRASRPASRPRARSRSGRGWRGWSGPRWWSWRSRATPLRRVVHRERLVVAGNRDWTARAAA